MILSSTRGKLGGRIGAATGGTIGMWLISCFGMRVTGAGTSEVGCSGGAVIVRSTAAKSKPDRRSRLEDFCCSAVGTG